MIKSPLNYLGNKFSLLEQIIPHFPDVVDFVDLFGGSLTVGINSNAKNVHYNEVNDKLFELVKLISTVDETIFLNDVKNTIKKFDLSKTNKESFIDFRNFYNIKDNSSLNLFVLLCFSYNHQLRFNKKGFFNTPHGTGTTHFSAAIENNFKSFNSEAKKKNLLFSNKDYLNFDLKSLNKESLIYCDPPYLISLATYNENNMWTEKNEKELLDLLDKVNNSGLKFALSNVVEHKGKENKILLDWVQKNHYNLVDLNKKYKSQKTHKITDPTREVLIKNY